MKGRATDTHHAFVVHRGGRFFNALISSLISSPTATAEEATANTLTAARSEIESYDTRW
jgi:hypothetical protein